VGDSEQNLVGAGSSARVRTRRVKWPVALVSLDTAMILAVVAVAAVHAMPVLFLAVYAGVLLFLLLVGGVYTEKVTPATPGKVPFTFVAITLAAMGVITLNFMVLRLGVTPPAVLGLWFATVAAVGAGRLVAWPIHSSLLRSATAREVLIIGSGVAATLLAAKIESHPELGLKTVGFVDEGPRRSVRGRPEPLLGGLAQLADIIEMSAAKVVIFAYTHNATPDMLAALYRADPKVEVLMMPRYFEYVSTGMQVEGLAGMPLLRLNRPELGRAERAFKRAEDLVIGGLASLLALLLVPFIALAIKLDSPGPVFYSHERIGKRGKPFRMYKFRSMADDADGDNKAFAGRLSDANEHFPGAHAGQCLLGKPTWRMTRVGKFLRTTSLDELPQLWNVLRGEMSLVGPRPPLPEEVAAYEEWHGKRLGVSPGITGMWQVSGRSDLPFDEMVWLDFAYVDSWSPWLDLSILLRTVPAVLSRRGAY
jgi:exopolysaccharide biosynthesis polyprenyl glycosylphosphotransferase